MKLPVVASFFQKKLASNFLALDVSDGSVKAVFFSQENAEIVVKGFSVREAKQGGLKKYDFKTVVSDCLHQSGVKVSKAIVGLSGHQTLGFLLVAKKTRKNPSSEISGKEMSDVYKLVRDAAYVQVKDRWSVLFAGDLDFVPLDLVVTSIMVDKKIVNDPVGLVGETIGVSVFCSYSEKRYYNWLTRTLKSVGLDIFGITTSLYAQSKLLSETFENYILVDIGRFRTDTAVVLGENVIQTRTFELGVDYFSHSLADRLQISLADAEGKLEISSFDGEKNSAGSQVDKLLSNAAKDWRSAFSSVLASMKGIKSYPNLIYLSGGGANISVLRRLLLEEEWRRSMPFPGDIDIKITDSTLWTNRVRDNLNVLKGPRMFSAISIGLVKNEIE